MKNLKVIKTFLHPDASDEFIVSEILTDEGVISKIISMNEVLDHLITVPIRPLTEKLILSKAEELILNQ